MAFSTFAWYSVGASQLATKSAEKTLATVGHSANSQIEAAVNVTLLRGNESYLHLAHINDAGTEHAAAASTYSDDEFVSKYVINSNPYPYNPASETPNAGHQFLIYTVFVKPATAENADLLNGETISVSVTWNYHLVGTTPTATANSRAKGYITTSATTNESNYDFDAGRDGNTNNNVSPVTLNATQMKTTNGQAVAYVFVYCEGVNGAEGTGETAGTIPCDFVVTAAHA